MNTNLPNYRRDLLAIYMQRDVGELIRYVEGLMNHPSAGLVYRKLVLVYRKLVAEKRISSPMIRAEELTKVLVAEVEQIIEHNSNKVKYESFYDIAEQVKKRFGPKVGEIYLETVMPNSLIEKARFAFNQDADKLDDEVLSKPAIDRYKEEALRVQRDLRTMTYAAERHSNFPIRKAQQLAQILEQLHEKTRENYSYLSSKPIFMRISTIGEPSTDRGELEQNLKDARRYRIFRRYLTRGEEPKVSHQIELRYAVAALMDFLRQHQVMEKEELRQIQDSIDADWNYKTSKPLRFKDWTILVDSIRQLNHDKQAIVKKLAKTFVAEYRRVEREMELLYHQILTQLADVTEFLEQFDPEATNITEEDVEKIRIAREKLFGLEGIFDFSAHLERSRWKPYMELERTALGVSAEISHRQIVSWINIYSIIFSNTDFLTYANEKTDLSRMRGYISGLSTYHLIQNVALLRSAVDKSLSKPDDEKKMEFKRFSEALKIKLSGLMKGKKSEPQSLREMIEHLGFVGDKTVQYLIAETYKGFQALFDAFSAVAEGAFVQDRDELIKESRKLYDQICNQCLKNFVVVKPMQAGSRVKKQEEKPTSWFNRLFKW